MLDVSSVEKYGILCLGSYCSSSEEYCDSRGSPARVVFFFSKHDSRSSLSETLEVLTCSPNSSIRHVLCILQYKNQSKLEVVASLEVLPFVYCLGFWKV